MKKSTSHVWLFAFVDVAFLLLLVFTQLSRIGTSESPVAEMRLAAPVVATSPEQTPVKIEKNHSQILVDDNYDMPFRMTRIRQGVEESRTPAMSYDELKATLAPLAKNALREPRPVVVPLPDSYSSDLLQATALVSNLWNQGSRAVVHTKAEGK